MARAFTGKSAKLELLHCLFIISYQWFNATEVTDSVRLALSLKSQHCIY